MLEVTLSQPQYKTIRLAAGDRALYESMFKMEPRKFISRPKFLTTMRLVYGFELANLDKVRKRAWQQDTTRVHSDPNLRDKR